MSKVTVCYNSRQGIRLVVEGKNVLINGAPKSALYDDKGRTIRKKFGYTELDATLWEAIKRTYAKSTFLRKGLMFVEDTKKKAVDAAKERKNEKTGKEPVAPVNVGVQPADETKA